MTGPSPAVAAVRVAVRRVLDGLAEDGPVLVACSGGPDSLALAMAVAFEIPRTGRSAHAVIVDHGWSQDSASRSQELQGKLERAGLHSTVVKVARTESETRAREARYEAIDKVASDLGAAAVLLGHTADDQAEQVLLGLARGSGTRTLAGMPRRRGLYIRPLLDLDRETTVQASLDDDPWLDPSNDDHKHKRARVRAHLKTLEQDLGPGFKQALKRTADLARIDADCLDQLAAAADDGQLTVAHLESQDEAIRSRILKRHLQANGCTPTAEHLREVGRLVTDWRGQGPLQLPAGVQVSRTGGRIVITAPESGRL